MNETEEILIKAREAALELAAVTDEGKNAVLRTLADMIVEAKEELLSVNSIDLQRMSPDNPLYDRLMLTPERLDAIAADMRRVADLPSPLGRVTAGRTLPNGLRLRRVSVPYGVIGVIYEARPNVSFDVFSLCFKAGSACVLKGGKDADNSNYAIVKLIKGALRQYGLNLNTVSLLKSTHKATAELLSAVGYVDLCIPRGGRGLIDFVRSKAKVPVIETGAGVVHAYFDEHGDTAMGARIINNAKTRRVSVCNALDCLIVHASRLADLPALCAPLAASGVVIYADAEAYDALKGGYPKRLLRRAAPESYGTEYMDYAMSLKTVPSLAAALDHIARYGSGHRRHHSRRHRRPCRHGGRWHSPLWSSPLGR